MMMKRAASGRAFLVAPMTALALLLGGCGGSGEGQGTVKVVLKEWGITMDRASAPAGRVTFIADNPGEDVHELVLLDTDLAPDKLPLNADGDVDEAAMGVQVAGEVEDIAPGKSGELAVDLAAGKYVLVCNISMPEGTTVEHHYALGMRAGF